MDFCLYGLFILWLNNHCNICYMLRYTTSSHKKTDKLLFVIKSNKAHIMSLLFSIFFFFFYIILLAFVCIQL
ncbi:hypothetical protein F4703DRAFT_1822330 [Phycomyces blakesleeanus]